MDQNNPQVYNNRAYTNMRMHNYAGALVDLDKAISLKPGYDKIIALGKTRDLSNSVCGHKSMAENNNLLPLVFLKLLFGVSC